MLKKFVSIRNVGPFTRSATARNPELSGRVLILGANGSGKSTLCAVLRSLESGEPSPITSRKALGEDARSTAELSFSGGSARFDGEAWSNVHADIAIFDAVFVDENVHSDHVVEVDREGSLYRLIIGEEGVRLLREDARLVGEGQGKASEILAAENAIRPHVPAGWDLTEFLGLLPVTDIDGLIAEHERALAAATRAKQVREYRPLYTLRLPTLPEALAGLAAELHDDLERVSAAEIADHLGRHGMGADDRAWIAQGLDHASDGSCPFCDAYIEGLPLISAYRTAFATRNGDLGANLYGLSSQLDAAFGAEAVARLKAQAEQNRAAIEFWRRHCTFDPGELEFPDHIFDAIVDLDRAAKAVLDDGAGTPYEATRSEHDLAEAIATYEAAQGRAGQIARATMAVNRLIAAKKQEVEAPEVWDTEAKLERLRAIKLRHTEPLASLCDDDLRLIGEKRDLDDQRASVRARLDEHTRAVMEPYEGLVNHYLDVFNASFRLAEAPADQSDAAASTYWLVLDDGATDPCHGETPRDGRILTRTLSSGDRTTLALALFLAALSRDQVDDTIVVFDDPCSGQDAYRRCQTVYEITEVARRSAQVIVLSHDATFLKQVWDKAPSDDRIALTLADHGSEGSKIMPVDLEGACQGRTETDLDDLHAYLTTGARKPLDMIRKMRAVLEVHCHTTYPDAFDPGHDSLGEIVREIRETGKQHPANDLYDELDQINEYTSQFHHGRGSTYGSSQQIDWSETAHYVRRTLKIVNALQA